jgi:hypothetical protein
MISISSTRKGMIIAIAMIATSIVSYYIFHFSEKGNSQYFILSMFILGILWVVSAYKKMAPKASAKDIFAEGFKAFVTIAFLMAIYVFVFYKLNPQICEEGIKENNALILKQGNKTIAEIEENANKLRGIFIPMMVMLSTIKFLFLGSIVSFISGRFLGQKINVNQN